MKEVTMTGLTNEQVQQRIEEGKINVNENPNTRSYKQIVRENVLTFFNFLNLALMIMVLLVGSYKNSMFMGIIVINTVIGIIQEVRAKKTLDKLAILTESKAVVLREGKKWSISTEKLVLDDIQLTGVCSKRNIVGQICFLSLTYHALNHTFHLSILLFEQWQELFASSIIAKWP